MNPSRFPLRVGHGLLLVVLALFQCRLTAVAQGFRLDEIRREAGGAVRVAYQGRTNAYYLLQRGARLPSLDQVVAAGLGTGSRGVLTDGSASPGMGFYRVVEIPYARAEDTDRDGIDDVYELQTNGLNPLNPADALLPMPGAGGQTYLDVYRVARAPLTTLAETSPFQGEDGVAITREVVLRFTRPLGTGTILTTSNLFATFGGRRVLSRVETASDRRSVTLFPLENLPANARVRVTFDPGEARDELGRRLDPAGRGEPGSIATIDFDTISTTPVGETGIRGWVYASEQVPDGRGGLTNRPLVNVTITVDGAEESLRTTTGADGSFRLQPAPAGRFFVHIDGRTATGSQWPQGAYYPVVGKTWEAVPGVATNLANGTGVIYLPLIPADALQPVSTTTDTTIAFPPSVVAANPAFAGVEVRVPANSLFDNSGVRGGRVGLAPVASDRLPEPLPEGLDHVLDITVQSDGPENFDRPVPVRFPNLPNPRTGERLPPGEKTALVSFNHDVGRWEVVGTMTVSADGQFLDSDPGVGVRQPGWHGWQPLTWPILQPPIFFPQLNPWIVANPPNPPGPLPPPLPQPPGPTPPEPIPDDDWPPIPPVPDDGPDDDWPDFPPWQPDGPNGPPDGPPDSDPDDTGDDDPPGGGGGGGGGGGAGSGGGVSAGPFCLEANIEDGCTNGAALVPAGRTVPIASDGGAAFALRYRELNGVVTAEVTARSSGRVVFATQVDAFRPPNSVGFGPAAQAFVHVFRQTTPNGASGDEVVQLVTLRGNGQNYAPAKTITMGASYLNASAVRFSPHGRYLIYTALKTDGRIALMVVDVTNRETVFSGSFPYSTAPVLVQPGDMVQFGPDCADRTMVFQFGDTPTSLAWHLINLETRREVARRRIAPGNFSRWEFTSCGDGVWLNPGPALQPEIIATWDGRVVPDFDELALASASVAAAQQLQAGARGSSPLRLQTPSPQSSDPNSRPRPLYSRGLHYWQLVDMLTGQVVQRGRSGASGGLMEGVLLSPNRPFRLFALRAADFHVGRADFISGNVGANFRPPYVNLLEDRSPDGDGDGLGDLAEFIVGTSPTRADTNTDGLKDGAAVRAGLDPLEGSALATGVVASVPLPGSAIDVCAIGDRVLVALGGAGVAVIQHPPNRNPTVIARVDTPGDARRVACSGSWLAVADGPAGLQILDISDPPAARIVHFLSFVGEANAVTTAAGIAYVGTQGGRVVLVDLASGTELGRFDVGSAVQDLQFGSDRLYVLSNRRIQPYRFDGTDWTASGPGVTSGSGAAANRLFIGGGWAYVTHGNGYRVFDLADPDVPVERTSGDDTQIGWSQLVSNGSGLGLAAAGPQANQANQVQVYNVADPARNDQFLTSYPMPATAASVAIHQGLAYVAATTSGLQVLNYLAADTGTTAPSIALQGSYSGNPPSVETGAFVSVQADAEDDIQVREVEFYLDGERVTADGAFPFELAFFAPALTAERTNLVVQAKAFDTAGNFTWSEAVTLQLLRDATPPRGRPAAPSVNGYVVSPTSIGVLFNEPIDPTTLTESRLTLTDLGPDRILGTTDDIPIDGRVVYLEESRLGELRFAVPVRAGRYEAVLGRGVADLSGNRSLNDVVWAFEVVLGTDSDRDGLTDEFEAAGGLDPQRADENNNGLPDAIEDFDGDGLTNGQEMLIGTHPRQARTFNGVLDRDLDRDGDWLTDLRELSLGTDAGRWDTDGDGWNDEIEVSTGASPLRPNAYLPGLFAGSNRADALLLAGSQFQSAEAELIRLGGGQAIQGVSSSDVLRLGGPNELGHSIVAAEPPVRVRIFDLDATDLSPNELPRAGAFVVEAEDFNHDGGQHVAVASVMPYRGGAYGGLSALLGVDYSNADDVSATPYRPMTGPNGVNLIGNLAGWYGVERPGWMMLENHRVGSPAPGDWFQYTRSIPVGSYWVWAAMSANGYGDGLLRADLETVTGNPTQPNPERASVGSWNGAGTGAVGNNRLVLLRNADQSPAVIPVTQPTTTLRVNLTQGHFDWLVLVPVSSAP